MPYANIEAARDAQFPTKIDDIELSLEQINHLAKIYDALKEEGKVEEPMAVAISQFKTIYKKKDENYVKAEFAEKKTFNVDNTEIFAVGTWNGVKVTKEMIESIFKTFNELKGDRGVPLKLGHNSKQQLLKEDGLPAAGWVDSLKIVGDKLVANFRSVPRLIKEFIETEAYKGVSIEVLQNWTNGGSGKKYPYLLSAVSLLGEQQPAVTGLADFAKLYSADQYEDKLIFEYIEKEEEKSMEFKEKYEEEVKKTKALEQEKKEFAEKLESKLAEEKKAKKELEAQLFMERKSKVEAENKIFIEKNSSEDNMKITPACLQFAESLVNSLSEEKEIKFKESDKEEVALSSRDLFFKFIENLPKVDKFNEKSTNHKPEATPKIKTDPTSNFSENSQKLDALTKLEMKKDSKLSYEEAGALVIEANPELAE